MSLKVNNELTIYEEDGREVTGGNDTKLCIASHWNRDQLVVLHLDIREITVSASELRAAIDNATNVG